MAPPTVRECVLLIWHLCKHSNTHPELCFHGGSAVTQTDSEDSPSHQGALVISRQLQCPLSSSMSHDYQAFHLSWTKDLFFFLSHLSIQSIRTASHKPAASLVSEVAFPCTMKTSPEASLLLYQGGSAGGEPRNGPLFTLKFSLLSFFLHKKW